MKNKAESDQMAKVDARWFDKLNKVLIGIGVLAFGLIIADRIVTMMRADDLPDTAGANQASPLIGGEPLTQDGDVTPKVSGEVSAEINGEVSGSNESTVPVLEDVFGSRLVLVSESEPLFVVTADERRIEIGDAVDERTTLAGVGRGRVVIERSGELLAIDLPQPQVQ